MRSNATDGYAMITFEPEDHLSSSLLSLSTLSKLPQKCW